MVDPYKRPILPAPEALREATAHLKASNEALAASLGGGGRVGGSRRSMLAPADLSVTVMQTMALRAATETGIYVPKESIDFAIAFVRRMFNDRNATFGYTSPDDGNFNRAGAGVVCLQSCGYTDDPRIPRTVKYMIENAKYDNTGSGAYDPWYGYYYCLPKW